MRKRGEMSLSFFIAHPRLPHTGPSSPERQVVQDLCLGSRPRLPELREISCWGHRTHSGKHGPGAPRSPGGQQKVKSKKGLRTTGDGIGEPPGWRWGWGGRTAWRKDRREPETHGRIAEIRPL